MRCSIRDVLWAALLTLLVVAWWLDHRWMGIAHEATLDSLSAEKTSQMQAYESARVARQSLADVQQSLVEVKRERDFLINAAFRRMEEKASEKRTNFDERSF